MQDVHTIYGTDAPVPPAFDYQAEAAVTMSNQFHGDKVTLAEFEYLVRKALAAIEDLDKLKKAFFYGKGQDIGLTHSVSAKLCVGLPLAIAIGGREDYEPDESEVMQAEVLLHMALGKITEAGEFFEPILKAAFGGPPIDRINLLEEIGDGMWYDANALTALGSTFDHEGRRNNAKLRERFGDKFSEHDAIHRDLGRERDTLELFGEHTDKALPVGSARLAEFGEVSGDGSGEALPELRDSAGLPLEGTRSVPKTPEERAKDALKRAETAVTNQDDEPDTAPPSVGI